MRAGTVVRMLLAGVGSAVLLAGCSTADLPLLGPSAQDLARGAADGMGGGHAVGLRGSVAIGGQPYTVDLTLVAREGGAITGSGTYRGARFQVVATGGHTYFKGADFWARVPDGAANDITRWPGFGTGWVLAGGDDAAARALARLHDLGGLVERLRADASAAKKGRETRRNGVAAIPVTDRGVTYYVTSASPHRLVHVDGRPSGAGVGALSLDVRSASNPDASAPGDAIDPTDPTTLPALYDVTATSDLQNCDGTSCGYTATIENTTGAPRGQTVATLKLLQQDGATLIGSCDAPVPAIPHGQSVNVTCRITGPGYAAFYASIPAGGSSPVAKVVTLRNPPYNA